MLEPKRVYDNVRKTDIETQARKMLPMTSKTGIDKTIQKTMIRNLCLVHAGNKIPKPIQEGMHNFNAS